MIKLFSLKQASKGGTDPNAKSGMGQKRASAAQLRITKGEWQLNCCEVETAVLKDFKLPMKLSPD